MVAANMAAHDAHYIRHLHASISKAIPHPTLLMIDSESALMWIQGKAWWSASCHIVSSHFAIQDWQKLGHIIPLKVDTSCQYANMFTKNLPHTMFVTMCKMVLGRLNNLSMPYMPEWQPALVCPQAGDSKDADIQPPQMTDLSAFHASLQAAHNAAEAQRVEAAKLHEELAAASHSG